MKSYQNLDRPTGILGVSFDDLGIFMSVVLVTSFCYTLSLKAVSMPGYAPAILIALFVVVFMYFRKMGKQKVAMYMHSKIAFAMLAPKKIIVTPTDTIVNNGYTLSQKIKEDKELRRRKPYFSFRKR